MKNFCLKCENLRLSWLDLIKIIFFSICIISSVTISIIVKSSLLTIFFSIFSILYVALLTSGLKIAVIFGMIQCILYIIESFLNRNYGEAILNIGVVFPLLAFSCFSWIKGNGEKQQIKIIKLVAKNY